MLASIPGALQKIGKNFIPYELFRKNIQHKIDGMFNYARSKEKKFEEKLLLIGIDKKVESKNRPNYSIDEFSRRSQSQTRKSRASTNILSRILD